MQTDKRILDDLARLAGGTLGALSGLKAEIETFVHDQMERVLSRMDLVRRDEVDAIKAMVVKAREENENLNRRLAALEARQPGAAKSPVRQKSPSSTS
ncbi:MAG: accessory factor UbiK family protein [Alphaproteobacteria bacterium]